MRLLEGCEKHFYSSGRVERDIRLRRVHVGGVLPLVAHPCVDNLLGLYQLPLLRRRQLTLVHVLVLSVAFSILAPTIAYADTYVGGPYPSAVQAAFGICGYDWSEYSHEGNSDVAQDMMQSTSGGQYSGFARFANTMHSDPLDVTVWWSRAEGMLYATMKDAAKADIERSIAAHTQTNGEETGNDGNGNAGNTSGYNATSVYTLIHESRTSSNPSFIMDGNGTRYRLGGSREPYAPNQLTFTIQDWEPTGLPEGNYSYLINTYWGYGNYRIRLEVIAFTGNATEITKVDSFGETVLDYLQFDTGYTAYITSGYATVSYDGATSGTITPNEAMTFGAYDSPNAFARSYYSYNAYTSGGSGGGDAGQGIGEGTDTFTAPTPPELPDPHDVVTEPPVTPPTNPNNPTAVVTTNTYDYSSYFEDIIWYLADLDNMLYELFNAIQRHCVHIQRAVNDGANYVGGMVQYACDVTNVKLTEMDAKLGQIAPYPQLIHGQLEQVLGYLYEMWMDLDMVAAELTNVQHPNTNTLTDYGVLLGIMQELMALDIPTPASVDLTDIQDTLDAILFDIEHAVTEAEHEATVIEEYFEEILQALADLMPKKTIDPTIELPTLPEPNLTPLQDALQRMMQKFPFSTINNIVQMLTMLVRPAAAPQFDLPVPNPANWSQPNAVHVDLSIFDIPAAVGRTGIMLWAIAKVTNRTVRMWTREEGNDNA